MGIEFPEIYVKKDGTKCGPCGVPLKEMKRP